MKTPFDIVFKRWVPSDAGRPDGLRGRERKDCTIRATSAFLGINYQDAKALLVRAGRGDGRWFHLEMANQWLAEEAAKQKFQIKFSTIRPRMRLYRVLDQLPETGRFVLGMRRHVFAYVNGLLLDDHFTKPNVLINRLWELRKA